MNNKENIPFWSSPPKWQPHQATFSAKPCKRYQMKDIYESVNSSMQASSIKPKYGKQSMQFPQELCDKSSLALSIRDKFNSRHLNSVHELIALAREKKSDIEDLLRSEEYKAQNEDQDSLELSSSLRKLKKVVRLLQIVCKMINGKEVKNEENSYLNAQFSSVGSAYPHQDVFSHEIYQQKIENLQHELQVKSCEIKRLKKLVQLLSAPQKSQSKEEGIEQNEVQQDLTQNYDNHEAKTCSMLNISEQNEEDRICDIGTQSEEQLHLTKKLSKKLRQSKLEFVNVFSFWTLFQQTERSSIEKISPIKNQFIFNNEDEKYIEEEETVRNSFKYQTNNPSTFVCNQTQNKLDIFSYPVCLGIDGKANYLKRFKSVVKIAMNSINLCLRFLNKEKENPKIQILNEKLSKFAVYFNQNYHIKNGVYSEDFGKQVKFKLKQAYDEAHQLLAII